MVLSIKHLCLFTTCIWLVFLLVVPLFYWLIQLDGIVSTQFIRLISSVVFDIESVTLQEVKVVILEKFYLYILGWIFICSQFLLSGPCTYVHLIMP